jgi:L-ascorbate metabolism protein UlaG (beta-lactamase superfamily)
MIRPLLQDDAFLADLEAADPHRVHLWWLGQSGYLVQGGGARFLLDPYLSDSLTRKYEATDKPHVRMTERVVDPSHLTGIAFVTSTHNHTDHLDAETLLPVLQTNPSAKLICAEANRDFVIQRLGHIEPICIGIGGSVEICGVSISAVPAAHEDLSPEFFGFVVRVAGVTVYHSGDTVLYAGMAEILKPFGVDIALLPVNGRAPERRVSGNLWGDEAAQLATEISAKLAIPCHYDMFTFNTESPDLFVRTCVNLGQPYRVLRAGERFSW